MKKKPIIFVFFVLSCLLTTMAVTACSKEKTCRCAVLHSSKVRIIKINGGKCEDIKIFRYHTDLDSLKVDSLICTDYEFAIDSIYDD